MTFRDRINIRHSQRNGAALMEFAICMPMFFLITMATIETCRMIYLRQSLKICAYECARLGIIPGMTKEVLVDQSDVILKGRRLRDYQFTCSPEDPSTLTYGQLFTTTVTINPASNSLVGSWFFKEQEFTKSVTIMAEF